MEQAKKSSMVHEPGSSMHKSSAEIEQRGSDYDPNSVTPVDVNNQLYARLLGLLKISKMSAAEIVDVALRVTATAIENALLKNTECRVTSFMIEREIEKEVERRHTAVLQRLKDEAVETDEELLTGRRPIKKKGSRVTYADELEDVDEQALGLKLVTTLKSILSFPKEPDVVIPEALQAAEERASVREMNLRLPVSTVHKMIAKFMEKYAVKKEKTGKGPQTVSHCRYCNALVNLEEQKEGIFCCEDARYLREIYQAWKNRISSPAAEAGFTETPRATTEMSQLQDNITEATAQGLKSQKEEQTIKPGLKSQKEEEQTSKPGASQAVLKKDTSSVKARGQGQMKVENIKVADAVTGAGRVMEATGKQLKEDKLVPKRERSKIPVKTQQGESQTAKGKQQQQKQEAEDEIDERSRKQDSKVFKTVPEKSGQKGGAKETWYEMGYDESQGVKKKTSESSLSIAEDEMRKGKDVRGKGAATAGEDQRSKTGLARDGRGVYDQSLQSVAGQQRGRKQQGGLVRDGRVVYDQSLESVAGQQRGRKQQGGLVRDGRVVYDQSLESVAGQQRGRKQQGGLARDGRGVYEQSLESVAGQPAGTERGRKQQGGLARDGQGAYDQSLESVAGQPAGKERGKKQQGVAGKDADDRQISRGKELRSGAQSEMDMEYRETKDREKDRKAKQLDKYDDIPGKEKHTAGPNVEQMRILGVHEQEKYQTGDERTGGKLQQSQQEKEDRARQNKDMSEQEVKKIKSSHGRDVSKSGLQDMDVAEFPTTTPDKRPGTGEVHGKATDLEKSSRKDIKESHEEKYDSEVSEKSKKKKGDGVLEVSDDVRSLNEGTTGKETSSSRGSDAKETVKKKQSRGGKELLFTEEDKVLNDQSLSEQGRKHISTPLGGKPTKQGHSGRDAHEEPSVSRSVRDVTQSDSSQPVATVSKTKGHTTSLKEPHSPRKSSQHHHGASDGPTLHDSSKKSPEIGKTTKMHPQDRAESTFRGSDPGSSMQGSMSSSKKGLSISMGKGTLQSPVLSSRHHTSIRTRSTHGSTEHSRSKSDDHHRRHDVKTSGHALRAYPSIFYRLSEKQFIDLGWTILPSKPDPHRLVTYQATGARIPCFWVCPKKNTTMEGKVEKMLYKDGKTFALFYSNGNVKVFYPNGRQAIIIKHDEKGCLITILSPGGKNEKGTYLQPVTVGTFDSLGHGVIYNDYGGVRLSYNQEGGTVYETPHGRPVKWRWPISFAINFIKAHFNELHENNANNAETLLHIQALLAARDKKENREVHAIGGKELRKESSLHKETSFAKEIHTGSPGLKDSAHELKSVGSVGSPKKSLFKEQTVHSPEKKESNWGNLSNKSKRRLQQEDTPSFTPLFMPPALAACNIGEVQAAAERKRQSLLNKARRATASCTATNIIVLKINSFLGFRLLDQAAINIQFTAQDRFIRLELGVQIDPMVEAQVEMVEPNLLTSCVPAQLLCLRKNGR